MKTSFNKLFSTVAVTIALAGGMLSTPVKAQGLVGQILHEVLAHNQGHHDHHGHGHSRNGGSFSQNGGSFQRSAAFPDALLGAWTVNDGRLGGRTDIVFAENGTITEITFSVTQFGVQESGRVTRFGNFGANGLVIDNQPIQASLSNQGVLSLTARGQTMQLIRAGQQNGGGLINNGLINNGQQNGGNFITIGQTGSGGSRRKNASVPVEMQGVWFEVGTDANGSPILSRYDLKNDGSYEMQEFAVSASGQVDLSRPFAQLAQIATADERSAVLENGVLTLGGTGKSFSEGPYAVVQSGKTLSLTSSNESRTWTRTP